MLKSLISIIILLFAVQTICAFKTTSSLDPKYLEQIKNNINNSPNEQKKKVDRNQIDINTGPELLEKIDIDKLNSQPQEQDSESEKEKSEQENVIIEDIDIYGHDLFEKRNDFIGDQNVNVSDDYLFGSGDSIVLQFWGRIIKTESIEIGRDGYIYSEVLGKIKLGNITYSEAKSIVAQITDTMEGVSVSLAVDSTKSVRVLVSGSVNSPGYYVLNTFAGVTQAITTADGVRDDADIRRVNILRDGNVIDTIDYYSLLNKGEYKPKIKKLQPNDVVFVPKSTKRVKISGAVKQEAYYDLLNERHINEALGLAGGLMPGARYKDVLLTRLNKNTVRFEVKKIDISDAKDKQFLLRDGDDIRVYAASPEYNNAILLKGNVYFPGHYEYKSGMRISDILKSTEQIKKNTEINSAYIMRVNPVSRDVQLLSFSLKKIFDSSDSADNFLLEPNDEIVITDKYEILSNIEIMVVGEVANPGKVKSEKDASVYGIITKAGGFTSDSNINNIEILRYEDDEFVSAIIDVNESMATKAPAQGYIIVHNIYESLDIGYVEVMGDVMNPGEYIHHENMLLSTLLKKTVAKDSYDNDFRILLYRGGIYDEKELFSFTINGLKDDKADIQLYKGDRVEISLIKKNISQYVHVEGAVYDKGQYIYGAGMTVADLLTIAGGFTESAFKSEVEIIRKKIVGSVVKREYLVVKEKDFDTFQLYKNDNIVVKNISDYNKVAYVTLKGEFVFPGVYPIKDGEKLSTVIRRAGGFTESAYLFGTKFQREKVRREKESMLSSMIQRLERDLVTSANVQAMTAASDASISSAELFLKTKDNFIESLKKVKPDGRVVINLDHPRLLKGSVNDIELENGDEIYIPRKQDYITVSGAVLNQGAFVFNDRMQWQDYVTLAGGYLNNADKSNIYIMRANGTVQRVTDSFISWSPKNDRWEVSAFSNKKTLSPGDSVIVPDDYSKIAWLRNIKDITQILMQIAVTGGVAANLF